MFRPSSLLTLLALSTACRSADSWRDDADGEVYAILDQRRAELGVKDSFTIVPPVKPLRAVLLERMAEGQAEPLHLDLVAALQVASENSRDWQDQREVLFRTALTLTRERWNFSVQQNGTMSAFLSGPGGTAETDGGFLSNLNLFKLLGIGTSITLDAGLDLLEDIGHADAWDAISHLSLNITQPLLRGFGKDIVMEPLTQAERDVIYQARAYERFRRTFAVTIAQGFFRVLERVDRLKNEEANYENLGRLRERNEAMAEAGRMTDVELDQARQDELSAEDRLVAARRDLDAALDAFKFILGLPIDTELVLDENGQRTLEAWPALEVPLDEALVIRTGLEKRLDHATTRDRVEDAERGVHVAADALRMGLDVAAQASVVSPDGDGASLRMEDVDWKVALGIDLPVDRIPERNAYRSALISLDASRRAAEESADQVTSDLRNALRFLDAAQASFRIQSGSVILANRRVESAVLNLEAGRVSTRDVLESQEALLDAQNALASALTDTILAGLALYRDMELLEVTPAGIAIDATPVGAQP